MTKYLLIKYEDFPGELGTIKQRLSLMKIDFIAYKRKKVTHRAELALIVIPEHMLSRKHIQSISNVMFERILNFAKNAELSTMEEVLETAEDLDAEIYL